MGDAVGQTPGAPPSNKNEKGGRDATSPGRTMTTNLRTLAVGEEQLLTPGQVAATAAAIEACQQPDGLILWFDGGHADPWNHVEAAMGLASAGRPHAAEAAYNWLAANQHPAGSWHNYYTAHGVKDPKVDTNCCAYIAVGVWHHWQVTGDCGFVESMWPAVERALDFVVGLRKPAGHIPWAVHANGTPWPYALLTGSSSIAHSLRCGIALAHLLGRERPHWGRSVTEIERLIRRRPDSFEPKDRWAMDWYYPVLCGALEGAQARAHLAAGALKFLLGEHGVRCVTDQPWVTAAETSECALAYLRTGDASTARRLFEATSAMRNADGSYYTGWVVPQSKTFPDAERSSYTAAAVLLAADALDRRSGAADALITTPVN
ncbi:prenyltransferase [Candidatus Poriferisodalis sp.]|uniref:prenyltransferase n=1 Tax=Candidatus Poriferisodalis sp. TaxID=3101277 RepID=UPI003B023565